MWDRKELKESAKKLLNKNYWTAVLVSFVFALAGGGNAKTNFNFTFNVPVSPSKTSRTNVTPDYSYYGYEKTPTEKYTLDHPPNVDPESKDAVLDEKAAIFIFIVFAVSFTIIFAIAIVLLIFLLNPLQVGCNKYFINCIDGEGKAGNMGMAFEKNYKNIMKIMFFKDLYIFLWSLLFLIPGIIKSYEYMMVPYILADDPSIDKKEAFALSRKMMDGNKFDAFVMQLSFIGWNFLSLFTLGILSIFYVNPYINFSFAYLYDALREHKPELEEDVPVQSPYGIDLKKY